MYNKQKITEVKPVIVERVEYRVETALFGLLRWERKVCATKLGDRLEIYTTEEPQEIYLNGKLL